MPIRIHRRQSSVGRQHKPQGKTDADRQTRRALNTGSKQWRQIRKQILRRDEYTCQICGSHGDQVDHKDGDSHNNEPSNLWTLCIGCHSKKTMLEQQGIDRFEGLIPRSARLIVVCGPPGSGKSDYVRSHTSAGDVVVDPEIISRQLFGLSHYELDDEQTADLQRERMDRISSLSGSRSKTCWIVLPCPSFRERKLWRDKGASVIVMEASKAECRERIMADQAKPELVRSRQLADLEKWK